jgi:hypothetical protein
MGLRGGGGILWPKHWEISCFLSGGDSVASWFFWKQFLGENFLGGRLPSFCLPYLLVFLVDCCMVHFPFFTSFALCPFGSLHPSPIFFFRFMAMP